MTGTCFGANAGRVVDSLGEHQFTGVWPDITSMEGGRLGLAELLATRTCTLALTVRLTSDPYHSLKDNSVYHRNQLGACMQWVQAAIKPWLMYCSSLVSCSNHILSLWGVLATVLLVQFASILIIWTLDRLSQLWRYISRVSKCTHKQVQIS